MIRFRDLNVNDIGRWVIHRSHPFAELEEGRIKKIGPKVVWVVFYCDGDWDRYDQFAAVLCHPGDLEFRR